MAYYHNGPVMRNKAMTQRRHLTGKEFMFSFFLLRPNKHYQERHIYHPGMRKIGYPEWDTINGVSGAGVQSVIITGHRDCQVI